MLPDTCVSCPMHRLEFPAHTHNVLRWEVGTPHEGWISAESSTEHAEHAPRRRRATVEPGEAAEKGSGASTQELSALSIKGDQTLPSSPVPRLECIFCLFSLHIDLCSKYQFFTQSDFCLSELLKFKICLLILTFYNTVCHAWAFQKVNSKSHIEAGQRVWPCS